MRFGAPRDALRAGISVVSQEVSLVPDLSVAANIFMGRMPTQLGAVDLGRIHRESQEALAALGLSIDPRVHVRHLPFSSRQLVEIARAISWNARVLILDEPTSALSEAEIDASLRCAAAARKAEGVSIIYITHRLDELPRIAERVTVMRDGQVVSTLPVSDAAYSKDTLIRHMIGRNVDELAIERKPTAGAERLRAEALSCRPHFEGVSLSLRAGEIVGLTGLAGSGHSEVGLALFGALPLTAGRVVVGGTAVTLPTPHAAVKRGLALVPDDRKKQGLVLSMTVAQNVSHGPPGPRVVHWPALVRAPERHGRPIHPAPRHPGARARAGRLHAERRQPAEGRARQVARWRRRAC